MPDNGGNDQPYYEEVTPRFQANNNNLYNQLPYDYVGTYNGPTVYFAWRDYVNKTHPFRFEHPITQANDSK